MNKTLELLEIMEKENIEYIEDSLPCDNLKGLYFDNTIIVDKNILTSNEKKCVLAEEIGHYKTSYGDILSQKEVSNKQQEERARFWACQQLLPFSIIIEAYLAHCKNRSEFAEFANVTEEFIEYAINTYKKKYGLCQNYKNYTIYFDPLGVMEKFNY